MASAFPTPKDIVPNGPFLAFREDVVSALRHQGSFVHRCKFLSDSSECRTMLEWLEKLRVEAEAACWDTELTTTTRNEFHAPSRDPLDPQHSIPMIARMADFTTMTLRIAVGEKRDGVDA